MLKFSSIISEFLVKYYANSLQAGHLSKSHSRERRCPSSCYLDLTRKLNNRKELVKLRIGNHKLLIETGRYDQIPRDNRLCHTCGSNQIEDEFHLLFHCTKYCTFRDEFCKKNRESNTKQHNYLVCKSPKN